MIMMMMMMMMIIIIIIIVIISIEETEAFISSLERKRCLWCPKAINKDRVVKNEGLFFPITRCHVLSFRK